jgi:hypothetical protein
MRKTLATLLAAATFAILGCDEEKEKKEEPQDSSPNQTNIAGLDQYFRLGRADTSIALKFSKELPNGDLEFRTRNGAAYQITTTPQITGKRVGELVYDGITFILEYAPSEKKVTLDANGSGIIDDFDKLEYLVIRKETEGISVGQHAVLIDQNKQEEMMTFLTYSPTQATFKRTSMGTQIPVSLSLHPSGSLIGDLTLDGRSYAVVIQQNGFARIDLNGDGTIDQHTPSGYPLRPYGNFETFNLNQQKALIVNSVQYDITPTVIFSDYKTNLTVNGQTLTNCERGASYTLTDGSLLQVIDVAPETSTNAAKVSLNIKRN